MSRRVFVADDLEMLSAAAARIMVDVTTKAIDERGRATLLVSGGSSVRKAYETFGRSTDINWNKVYIFWGDDRFVDLTNPYSNYGLVRDTILVNAAGLPDKNVFPINVKAENPAACAEEYSDTIRQFFKLSLGEWPVFDLAQNGMGPDGHTASIFPHSPPCFVEDKIAVMNHAGLTPWVDRITLTLPVFNKARTILFIASGASKSATLKQVIEGSPTVGEKPAAFVNPPNGETLWLVDPIAAKDLTSKVEKAV